jgi:hypothetical protein
MFGHFDNLGFCCNYYCVVVMHKEKNNNVISLGLNIVLLQEDEMAWMLM